MATHPQQGEVDRAKAQLKASLLLGLDGTTAIAEDIGRSVVTTGKRSTPKEIEAAIDAVTVDDIKRCGQKYINDRGKFFFFSLFDQELVLMLVNHLSDSLPLQLLLLAASV